MYSGGWKKFGPTEPDGFNATISQKHAISRQSTIMYLSPKFFWELNRVILCLAFDEEALNLLRQYSGRAFTPVVIKRARILRKDNAESLLTVLKSQSIQQNLASLCFKKAGTMLRSLALVVPGLLQSLLSTGIYPSHRGFSSSIRPYNNSLSRVVT
jgi:hypothetical protein